MTSKPPFSDPVPPNSVSDSLGAGVHHVNQPRSQSKFTQPHQPPSGGKPVQPEDSPVSPTPKRHRFRALRWLAVGIVATSSTVGFGAAAVLLKLPALPNCPQIFLPTTSASMRLYCAQLAANKGTRSDLLEAVYLVQELPDDHPLRPEVDRFLEEWVEQLLDLTDESFQAGELEEAITLARQLTVYVDRSIVDDRVAAWEAVWAEAEEIVAKVEELRKEGAWGQAFQAASKLTRLENRYWSTTRYDELFEELNLAREEGKKLDAAFAKLNRGGLENLLAAIADAEKIETSSPAHPEAKTLISEAKGKLVELAVRSLKSGNWQTTLKIVNRVPSDLKLQSELDDLSLLADAASMASFGTQINLEDAIREAQAIEPGRPLYSQAQTLIKQWQGAISAGLTLDSAVELSRDGTEAGLTAAIAQARGVAKGTPPYAEARRRIRNWQAELKRLRAPATELVNTPIPTRSPVVQTPRVETRREPPRPTVAASPTPTPNNNRETENAIANNEVEPSAPEIREPVNRTASTSDPTIDTLPSLNDIRTPSSISSPSGTLSSPSTSTTSNDNEILRQANQLANQGRYDQAARIAQQISAQSALYEQAQQGINRWQGELQAVSALTQAKQQARAGTPEALSSAIQTVQQVERNSRQASRAQQQANAWSGQILQAAINQSRSNPSEAIRIARLIPVGASNYGAAQSQIATWESALQSQQAPPTEEVTPEGN